MQDRLSVVDGSQDDYEIKRKERSACPLTGSCPWPDFLPGWRGRHVRLLIDGRSARGQRFKPGTVFRCCGHMRGLLDLRLEETRGRRIDLSGVRPIDVDLLPEDPPF